MSRRIVTELLCSNVRLKLDQTRMSFSAGRTGCEMVLDFRVQNRIQFAVEIGLDQITRQSARHLESLLVRAVTHSSRRLRARASRDMTVPIGTLAVSAFSLSDISSISRITMTSRYSSGSASMQFRNIPKLASFTRLASGFVA